MSEFFGKSDFELIRNDINKSQHKLETLLRTVTQVTLPQMKHGDFITFYNGEFKHEILKLEIGGNE